MSETESKTSLSSTSDDSTNEGIVQRDLSKDANTGKEGIEQILNFWYGHSNGSEEFAVEFPKEIMGKWFMNSKAYDAEITEKFTDLLTAGGNGDLDHWLEDESGKGGLALVILLDQFSRQIYRGKAQAFDYDAKAREIATKVLADGFPEGFHMFEISFLLMPFEHSEDLKDHEYAVEMFQKLHDKAVEHGSSAQMFVDYEAKHKSTIEKFGRYPHRNEVLGRESSKEEEEFLETAERYGQ